MISRETRASGLLRLLSSARRMTAGGLVSETHMQLGSHSTVVHVKNVNSRQLRLFTSGVTRWEVSWAGDDMAQTSVVDSIACCQAPPSGERVATLQKVFPTCIKIFNTIYFNIWSEYKAIIAGIRTYRNILIKILLTYGWYHMTPMWQSNVSDFPQRVFKASSLRNLLQMYFNLCPGNDIAL